MSTSCPHIFASYSPPSADTAVHKTECVCCFDTPACDGGLNVCLTCFQGFCRQHAELHTQKSGHALYLNITHVPKPQETQTPQDQPKPSKMALGVPGGFSVTPGEPEYDEHTSVICMACPGCPVVDPNASPESRLPEVIAQVISARSAAMAEDTATWEEKIVPCPHTETLVQTHTPQLSELTHCNECELSEHLWLCMTCGHLGCARRNFDGSGGNEHALAHYRATGHPVVCQMGTITPEGHADVNCYACDCMVQDPHLSKHLAAFGINIADQTKTVATMAEMEIEQNIKLRLTSVLEGGKELELLYGPWRTGLQNLGNTCYMNSVLQVLMAQPEFRRRYLEDADLHLATCARTDTARCFHCQMAKLALGLGTGKYSQPPAAPAPSPPVVEMDTDADDAEPCHAEKRSKVEAAEPEPVQQAGISPRMFKTLVCGEHPDFRTMEQQDAHDFFHFFLKTLRQQERASGTDPARVFRFKMQQRLQCTACGRARYQDVDATDASVPLVLNREEIARLVQGQVAQDAQRKAREDARKAAEESQGKDDTAEASTTTPTPPPETTPQAPTPTDEDLPCVPLEACFAKFVEPEEIDFRCPACQGTKARKAMAFKTFPELLMVQIQRTFYVDWVPRKLDALVRFDHLVDLAPYTASEPNADEALMPEEAAPERPKADEAGVEMLMSMGFPRVRCEKALLLNENRAEPAMEWILAHMDDPDIDVPLPDESQAAGAPQSATEKYSGMTGALTCMGFTETQAIRALYETDGNVERAIDWVFSHLDESNELPVEAAPEAETPAAEADTRPPLYRLDAFITHQGQSVHSGHYVCHVRDPERPDQWVLFNDRKVALTAAPPIPHGYLFFFRKATQE